MTIFADRRRVSTPRQPLFPENISTPENILAPDNSPGAYLRVPPTGIPKPDQEDSPSGLSKLAAGMSVMALVLLTSMSPVSASVDGGVGLQFGVGGVSGIGISTGLSLGPPHRQVDRDGGAAISGKLPRPMPGSDWSALSVQLSQASDADGEGSVPAPATSDTGTGIVSDTGSDTAAADDGTLPEIAQTPTVLPDRIRQVILLDPRVAEMSARACQMAHRVGLARAEGRPKVTATLTGSRQIVGRVKKIPQSRTVFEDGRLRSITPHGAEEIRRSGAHTREFDHREKNNIYDGKISVRHTILDWGQRSSRTEARVLGWQAAQIDARVVMRERSYDLLQLVLTLRRSDEVIAALKANFDVVTEEVDAVRARVEAGAGRLSDLREAQLVQLDQEIAINRAEAERDIILEHLQTEFDLNAEDGWMLAQAFLSRRQDGLAILPADRSDKAHAIRLRTRGVTHEADDIRASRYPKFDAVIDGTIFDMTDYEDEYEVVGKLEMSVPLYDGGTARARLRETAWRENELKSSLEALLRTHDRETEGLAKRFNQMTREESEALARRDELAAQLRSLRERQGKTVSSPLAVARLLAQIGAVEARLAEIRFDRELLRARALLVAEQIDSVLGLSMEDSAC